MQKTVGVFVSSKNIFTIQLQETTTEQEVLYCLTHSQYRKYRTDRLIMQTSCINDEFKTFHCCLNPLK